MWWLGAVMLAGACGRGPFWEFPEDPCGDDACISVSTLQRSVDILFVIDNSGSMGVEQGTLAANFPAFVEVLEQQQFGASYRIGITTTDAGGALRVSSCRERLWEFVFDDNAGTYIDESFAGCLASCGHDAVATVATGADAVGQPWIEQTADGSNLGDGLSIADAMRCAGPQGINGSGFEAPLESMYGVLQGNGNSAGFLRDEALLAIVFVTDENDCSLSDDDRARLQSDAGAALWTDPEAPSSGACWKAGTICSGGPGTYDECHVEDIGWNGQPTTPDEAVLYPISRYVDALRGRSKEKAARGGSSQVLVGVIGGVPLDYPSTGRMVFADSAIPEFNLQYGIGPGCGIGTETTTSPPGIPPVRLAAFAEAFATDDRNLFSVCSNDYTAALQQIVDGLAQLSARTCVPGCVADHDPDEPGLQPNCRLVERTTDGDERIVPRCNVRSDGWSFPATSPTLCHRALLDTDGATATGADDMSQQCVTQGANLELVVERPPGALESPGTRVEVKCELTRPVGEACEEPPG
ncbi:MAG: hypothetical protein IPH07_30020 [Deltaproteobacteria bacterium]|nr:hypothetical protein [Deltaproteobacteria bacterium]MBK8715152.1 hypothetical protein [Deltaproteobacteria bacterium]MBP7285142.1 hypothetical protein [Nannocystaceae bacterium]